MYFTIQVRFIGQLYWYNTDKERYRERGTQKGRYIMKKKICAAAVTLAQAAVLGGGGWLFVLSISGLLKLLGM